MKRIFLALMTCLAATTILAGNAVIVILDGQSNPVPNEKFILQFTGAPQSQNGGTVLQWRTSMCADGTGTINLTNAAPGKWEVQPVDENLVAFAFYMPATNGTIYAADQVVAAAGATLPPDTLSWGVNASDRRYLRGIGAGANVTAVTNGNTVTISAAVGTNAVAAAQSNALAVATNSFPSLTAWQAFTNGAQAWSVYNLLVSSYNTAWGVLSTNIFASYATGAALAAGTNAVNGNLNARLTSLTNGGSLFNNVIRQPVISFDTTNTSIASDGNGGMFFNFPGGVIPIQINGADFINLGGVIECPSFEGGFYALAEDNSPGGFFSAVGADFYGANDPAGDFQGNAGPGLTNVLASHLAGTASVGTLSNGLFLVGGNGWLTLSNGVMTLTNTVTHNYVVSSNGFVMASGGFIGSGAGLTNIPSSNAELLRECAGQNFLGASLMQRDSFDVLTNMYFTWCDGGAGWLHVTSNNPTAHAVDSYQATYTNGLVVHSFTFGPALRNGDGAVTNFPNLIIQ